MEADRDDRSGPAIIPALETIKASLILTALSYPMSASLPPSAQWSFQQPTAYHRH